MNNIQNIENEIQYKLDYNRPFYAFPDSSKYVITDQDHFPYKRSFRGIYNVSMPVVFEREAGFCQRRDWCYKSLRDPNVEKANYCYEYPCSTTFPCKPDQKVKK